MTAVDTPKHTGNAGCCSIDCFGLKDLDLDLMVHGCIITCQGCSR